MTLAYPTVFTPHKEDAGFRMGSPNLECCAADGPDLEDAVENTRCVAYNWLQVEFKGGTYDFPSQSHYDNITLEQGFFIKYIMVTVELMPDND